MYILFEKANSRGDNSIYNYDAMGYTKDEVKAIKWVEENPEYRCYKYCTDKEVKQGYRQAVRHSTLTAVDGGSNPPSPVKDLYVYNLSVYTESSSKYMMCQLVGQGTWLAQQFYSWQPR